MRRHYDGNLIGSLEVHPDKKVQKNTFVEIRQIGSDWEKATRLRVLGSNPGSKAGCEAGTAAEALIC